MSNLNLNKVILGGRLTADPELKTTQSGISVTSFTVAVNRRFGGKSDGETKADFLNVTAWRQTAEFVTRFFHKGSSICVFGTLQTRSWEDQNGQKRFATEIVADEVYFVDSKGDSANNQIYSSPSSVAASAQYVPDSYVSEVPMIQPSVGFDDITSDDELPF